MSLYEKELINQVSRLERDKAELLDALKDARHQIQFSAGSGNAMLARLDALIAKHEAKE